MKLDPQTSEALARVYVQEPKFVEWLQSRFTKNCQDAAKLRDDIDVRQAQGRAQESEDILNMMKRTTEPLRKA